MSVPPLLVLAGTSEAGKSTAGTYLAGRGAHRVKIRTILTALRSGHRAVHEGVAVREDFDHAEFLHHIRHLPVPAEAVAVVLESFIDAPLAAATRDAWPAPCRLVFITATRAHRLHRLTGAGLDLATAERKLTGKDTRKRVAEQLDQWRALADDWIDNDGPYHAYLARLDHLLDVLLRSPRERP